MTAATGCCAVSTRVRKQRLCGLCPYQVLVSTVPHSLLRSWADNIQFFEHVPSVSYGLAGIQPSEVSMYLLLVPHARTKTNVFVASRLSAAVAYITVVGALSSVIPTFKAQMLILVN